MLRFTRGARYIVSGIAPTDYRTVTDSGDTPSSVPCVFNGIWRDTEDVYALFTKDAGGNLAIPLMSLERYSIERVQEPST